MKTLEQACSDATPKVEVKARRFGGLALQIPLEIKGECGSVLVNHKLGEFDPTRTFKGHIKKDKRSRR